MDYYLKLALTVTVMWAGFAALPRQSEGACVYQGSLYANNTFWEPDPCQDCSCHGDIVICESTFCKDPHCDFQKGEALQVPPNKCCPECVSRTEGFCQHEGQIHGHDTEWTNSGCSVCSCANSKVTCVPKPCPSISCRGGEREYVARGECCPRCVGTGGPCSFGGRVLHDGEEWQMSRCAKCVCRSGAVQCFTVECPPLICDQDESPAVMPGKCCPECVQKSCSVSGKEFQHEEQWRESSCTTCKCDRGDARCYTQTCAAFMCEKGENKVKRAGQCCEECVSSKGDCLYEGTVRYHEEMWIAARCEFCTCDQGQVICQKGECAKVKCAWGEELVHRKGKCCPECITSGSYCTYAEYSKETSASVLSGLRHVRSGLKWAEGQCKDCECQNGAVTCYTPSCSSCPVGTLTASVTGECCPECRTAQCHPDCLICSQSVDHCDVCLDENKVLQEGRCVYNCDDGFYQDGRECLACEETCSTCETEFECTSCSGSLLLKEGQCVASCEEGYFQDHFSCSECHESCLTCQGPSELDCVICRDQAQVLKEGACVSSCGRRFYRQRGVCSACDPSCETCHLDSPECLTCEKGKVLHNKRCISECPVGRYEDAVGRCEACHDACVSCSGPLATQCTFCSITLVLLQGRCLPGCGERSYPELGVCKACHHSCRTCVGPESTHCTQCLKPEEVLYAEQEFNGTPHGPCLPECKTGSYPDSTAVCRACHSSCSSCMWNSTVDCTTCASPRVLHDGQCLSNCPDGFYRQDSTCYSCHPSCKECHGGSDADCVTCHPHAALSGGYCLTSCQEGQYLNLVGYCVDCHPSCQNCVADLHDTGSNCLRCQNPRHLLHGDQCLSECAEGYYGQRGTCKKCHSSCKACSDQGPHSCTSCKADLVLTHNGMCTPTCFQGHYRSEKYICKSCNSQCLTCDSANGCTSCRDPTKVLLFGECQYESCAQQYYLDYTTRTCKECDWSCNACSGPLSSDCLQCMDDYVLHHGSCIQHCPPAFYRDGDNSCQRCEDRCLQCTGPEGCTVCEAPFYLSEGRCVRECGKQYYLDPAQQRCTACPARCLDCDSSGWCQRCGDRAFLKSGLCVPDCGPDFYGNPKTGGCEGDIRSPVLHVNGSLTVWIGEVKPLDTTLVEPRGLTDVQKHLLFHVVRPPTNGKLVKVVKGKEMPLNRDNVFSWKELKSQKVWFKHSKGKSRKGHFSLKVSDDQFFSEPKTIHIQAVSAKAPYLLRNEPLLVGKGEVVAITSSVLDIRDEDNAKDVEVVVLDPPRHGHLVTGSGDAATHLFKLNDISSGLLHYAHGGSNNQDDVALLQVNDGRYFQNILFQVQVTHKVQESHPLVSKPLVWIPEGGMLQITNRFLQARAFGASDSEIIYTITSDHPKFGEIILLVPMPADGPADGWQHQPDGRMATRTTTFTQQDINEGIVWYRHSGAQSQRDSLQFQVSNGANPQRPLDSHVFNIGILPQIPGAPRLSPGSSLHMTALEDRLTVINPDALSFVALENPSDKVAFNITVPLQPNQGTLEHSNWPYSPVIHFTQADINNGKIVYRPPTAAPHLRELMAYSFAGLPESVNFFFTVSDGEYITPEMPFTIFLASNNQQPPAFQVTTPFLEVIQGGKTPIGVQLTVSDSSPAPEDFIFQLLDPPQHGILIKSEAGIETRMGAGDAFTYEDVTQRALHYIHDGSAAEEDSMNVSVTDGITTTRMTVRIEVSRRGSSGLRPASGCPFSTTLASKSSFTLKRSHLAYEDSASPDSKIQIQIISPPVYGMLTKTEPMQAAEELLESSVFTMEDINNQKIRYSTDFETYSQPVTDVFHFIVFNADNQHLDNQMFTITITSAQSQLLVVMPAEHISVGEGERVLIVAHHILATESDTLEKQLMIHINSAPTYGYIENTRTGERSGVGATAAADISFSIQDILKNSVFYIQSIHEGIEPTNDSFSFYVTDESRKSEMHTISITIQRKNDEVPELSVHPVLVLDSSGAVIGNTSIAVSDMDTPDNELVFVVTKKPEYGQLRRRQFYSEPLGNSRILSQGSSFTYQDVLDELIIYTPSSLSAQWDEFGFSLTDGPHSEIGRLEISMQLPKNESPRLAVNRGLQLSAGSVAQVTDQHLKATDIDSDDLKIRYILKKDPVVGHLQMASSETFAPISMKGPVKSFTQSDLNKGQVEYRHKKGEPGGSFSFKFDVVDAEGNQLIDQSFHINVLEDKLPPSIIVNKRLVLDENSVKKITTLQLSATDQDSEPGELLYQIIKQPQLGYLEHAASPGAKLSSFSQADLASRHIQYIHTSEEEKHADEFTFTVSDGVNEVAQTFYITINPVDDSLPVLQNLGMRVQEGVRKTITEFELKATDADTEADSITFTIVQPPRYGTIERTSNGQHYRQTTTFTMEDIYQNRISYNHDGSNSLKDRFTVTVSDGTNSLFIVEDGGKEVVTAVPQKMKVDILPVDDGMPRIVTNLGLQWLEYMEGKATNLITKKELMTMDPDTEDKQLIYQITDGPTHGHLENKLKPGATVNTFSQEDVNLGLIRYVLHEKEIQKTMDTFKFLVKDSKPNIVSDNVFHIQWSLISFQYSSYNVSEKAGSVSITVKRTGNLNQYAIVLCRTEQGSATSSSSMGSKPGQQDYVEYAGQVQFDEREDTKACTVVINDDHVFEGIESFTVELSMPAYALLGEVTKAKVNINDTEDEPTLQFDKKMYRTNESSGFLFAPIERKGDSSSTVSALCYTVSKSAKGSSIHALESGSDFKSRGMDRESRVVFGPGVTMSTCDVKLIDDSEYEEEEEFEVALADASANARIGSVSTAKVIINGPNDAATISLGNATFTVGEDAGTIEIPVIRHGTDLSAPTSVWCATRPSDPPSATPGIDYIPSSKKVEFRPGKTEEFCTLTILDDVQHPVIEGLETFVIFLSSAQGAELTDPSQATVGINDTFQDVPSMQFGKDSYAVKEKEGALHVPVIRTGDLSYESSVRCYTQSQMAEGMKDFEERWNSDDSRITFLKGEKMKNCTVFINDDSMFEPEEQFRIYLGNPLGSHWSGARIGKNDVATVSISNDEDAPTIEFEEATYQIREPRDPDTVAVLNIQVVRRGDLDRTSKVRCSTRDGSAQSGVDYYPKSQVLKFSPGMDHIMFKVEILSNEDREWHESFSLVLGPDDPVEAVLGEITTAIVTILDQEAAGSLILPAPPIVVSLADYDQVEEVTKVGIKKSPSPGYPLVCVTPCDSHFPKYTVMKERCNEAGINHSSIQFSWEVATPTDSSGARSPFETITDNTPFTSINHMVLDSIYFSRRFHVRCVAKAVDKAGHVGTPLRSNIISIGTDSAICHTPVVAGTARGFQAQSFVATLKYLDVKHKEHPNRIHIAVQIPHQDGMLPLVSTMPLHNLNFLLSESIYRHQHICSNLVTIKDLRGLSEAGFLDEVTYDSIALGPGYDRPYQFDPSMREPKTIQLYKHLNLKSCLWTFDAYYDMTELIDVCGGSVTADFQVRDSAQSFLTVHVPLYVSYIYVTAPRGWASLEHHTEMEFSFFYDTVLWRTGIQTDSVLSARLQIIRIYIREDGRLVIEFKTHAKFRGQFVMEHHTLPDEKSVIIAPDHLGGIEFDLQPVWRAQTFDSPYQLWRATSSYSRKDYSGEYTIYLIPCTVQPTQPWIDPGDKPLACTAHAPERFLVPIAFQQTNRPVPVVYSLNTEFHLCNNEKMFLLDPTKTEMSLAEMDYKGAFSKGQTLFGRVLWNPDQNLNSAYRLQLEKVYLCTGKDGHVPFFDPTGTIYNEGPQYGCIQPYKHLKHRFLLLDRNQPEVTDKYFHDVPFAAYFASESPDFQTMDSMPGVDGFTMKVDALYKVEAGHQWYLQVIYIIGPETIAGPRVQRSLAYQLKRSRRDLVDKNGRLTLDDSLIYDNEGDLIKNGTNMKSLSLEMEAAAASPSFSSQTGTSIGSAFAAVMLLLLVLLATCFLTRKCKRQKKKKPIKDLMEDFPLNTKMEASKKNIDRFEKNFNRHHCTIRNINILNKSEEIYKVKGFKVKQVNLEVKVNNNLHDGTEV
uniref:Extracellular matrix protein FRAS1 isoform X2 n=1 Tax=Geotrypetes seraphini TaxID=260995 RepID=A0A6P8SL95_GEOSA|nr:extracellular matrix protein FRAS1 isoform X2 [Geotrypetes seraphini]